MIVCEHSNCAVCADIKEREVFKFILKTIHPDTYICKNARYQITNHNGAKFLISSLEFTSETEDGYYVRDMFTSEMIKLNKDNLQVMCIKKGECEEKPLVLEYKPKSKKAAD